MVEKLKIMSFLEINHLQITLLSIIVKKWIFKGFSHDFDHFVFCTNTRIEFFKAGLISREAAKVSESFVFTVGVGDDFVMRLAVDSVENLRTGIVQVLQASRLPKVSLLNRSLINLFQCGCVAVSDSSQRFWICIIWGPSGGFRDHLARWNYSSRTISLVGLSVHSYSGCFHGKKC